jgi:4-hydroxy-tetrahydrodipicolinate synthase
LSSKEITFWFATKACNPLFLQKRKLTLEKSMNSTQFTGAFTALVTPFKDGQVAYDELARLVEKQIEAGIDGLVAVGTTGESPTLDMEEHLETIRCVVKAARGKVPVLAGTGANSTAEGLKLTTGAHEAGADGMLIVAPYYNKPTQEGMFGYFSQLAEATDRTIVLYSIPGRCGVEIGVKTMERLRARYPHVNHLKEAGGSCDRVDQVRQALGDQMTILSGDDSLTLPFISLGAQGVISVASNLLPREVTALTHAALKGDFAEALRIHTRFYPLFRNLFIEANPVPVKFTMRETGMISSTEVRSPLCELEDRSKQVLLANLKNLQLV